MKSITITLLAAVLAVAAMMLLPGCRCEKKAAVPEFEKKLPVGVQLYSVRNDMAKDLYGTLKRVREMGYAGVEFYGEFYGHSVTEVKIDGPGLGRVSFYITFTLESLKV